MTAIYKTGTVSVNNGSNIVTGSGTSFIDVANAQLGDLFTVDGQKFYEIYAVDTNTQIKIRNIVTGGAFAETNVTAGNFAIIRNFTSQTSAEIAGKVLAVQQKWMNREEEMTDWFYTANDWATVTSINGDELNVMTPNGINNLLAPGAFAPDFRTFGVGSATAKVTTDWNTARDGGFYFATANNQANSPDNGLNWVGCVMSLNNENTAQILWRAGSGSSLVVKTRFGGPGNVWTDWEDFYHSGNSVNPLTYGVGTTSAPTVSNANEMVKSGIYSASGNGAVNFPEDMEFGSYIAMRRLSSYETLSALHIGGGGGQPVKAFLRRTTDNSATWAQAEIYHSANANFNKFGGNAANDVIAIGEAITSTVARFYFPLQSLVATNSFTLVDSVNVLKGSTSISSGITAGSMALSGLTSTKMAVIDVTTSGLTVGDTLNLRTNTATASITFNF